MREAAMFAARQNQARVPGLVSAALAQVLRFVAAWRRRRNFVCLDDLDDRLLDDIGLERSDIRWALDQPLSRPVGPELRRRAWRRARLGRG